MLGVRTADEAVVPEDDVAVGAADFVGREIDLGVILVVAGHETTPPALRVRLALGRVPFEDVVGHRQVAGLIDPGAAAAVAEGVAAHGDVRAGLLDADHAGAVGAVDEVIRDQRVLAELGEEEGAHAGSGDAIAVEDDPAALLDMHRVAQGAQGVAPDFDVLAADEVEGALARAGAVG